MSSSQTNNLHHHAPTPSHSVTEKAAVVALVAGAGVAAAWSLGLIRSNSDGDGDAALTGQQTAPASKPAAQEKSRSFVKDRV